ncbi:MAG TPA: electron transfer flavoprotein beta subunit/FixA family protein [Euryarchaeota archaeon]|nr:electron transfer flavoprotein beta subunit/FixA family protein [Euryarchaeota archaeon]
MRNIIVCVKVVPKTEDVSFDPVTKTLDRSKAENQINEADKNAIEYALVLKEKYGGNVILLSMGPMFFEPFLKIGIAMGADDAILLSDRAFAGADSYPTALTLASAIKKIGDFDLILCGEESSDAGLGQVPSQVAEFLDLPQALFVSSVEIEGNKIKARRSVKGGYEIVELPLPSVISIELGINQPRFPDFKRKRWADKEFKIKVWNMKDLGLNENIVGLRGSYTFVNRFIETEPPKRLRRYIEGSPEEQAEKLYEVIKEIIE